MSAPVYTTQMYLDRLNTLKAQYYQAGEDGSVLKLFKNDVVPDENSTLESFEEADFTGYAEVDLVMGNAAMNDQGMIVAGTNLCEFTSAGGVDTQMIYGVYVEQPGGSGLIAAQRFDTPQVMGGVYPQKISGIWRTSEPLTTYGWIDVEN